MNLPTIADIEILAQQAFKEIPKNMRTAAGGIDFNAFDFSDSDMVALEAAASVELSGDLLPQHRQEVGVYFHQWRTVFVKVFYGIFPDSAFACNGRSISSTRHSVNRQGATGAIWARIWCRAVYHRLSHRHPDSRNPWARWRS